MRTHTARYAALLAGHCSGEGVPPIVGAEAPTRQRCPMSAEILSSGDDAPQNEPQPADGLRLRLLPAASEPAFPLEHDYFEIVYTPLVGPTAVLLTRAMAAAPRRSRRTDHRLPGQARARSRHPSEQHRPARQEVAPRPRHRPTRPQPRRRPTRRPSPRPARGDPAPEPASGGKAAKPCAGGTRAVLASVDGASRGRSTTDGMHCSDVAVTPLAYDRAIRLIRAVGPGDLRSGWSTWWRGMKRESRVRT